MREYRLTTEKFVQKVEELTQGTNEWGTTYDIDRNQIRLREAVNGEVIVYLSPVIAFMSNTEYKAFRARLEVLLPEPVRELGRFW